EYRRVPALCEGLFRRCSGTHPAPEAGRCAAHQAHQRHASQPRSRADRPFATASVQHHQFSLPRIACQPSGISDNVMRMMEPGESYDIEIAIPSDHIPGTNWYHPHAHGSADVQIASGAVGALIIEGDFAEIPEIAAAKERLLVLTEAVFDRFGMVEEFATL